MYYNNNLKYIVFYNVVDQHRVFVADANWNRVYIQMRPDTEYIWIFTETLVYSVHVYDSMILLLEISITKCTCKRWCGIQLQKINRSINFCISFKFVICYLFFIQTKNWKSNINYVSIWIFLDSADIVGNWNGVVGSSMFAQCWCKAKCFSAKITQQIMLKIPETNVIQLTFEPKNQNIVWLLILPFLHFVSDQNHLHRHLLCCIVITETSQMLNVWSIECLNVWSFIRLIQKCS